jgi:hypothetical protein
MIDLEQQGGPLGKWGLCLKNVIHIRSGQVLSQGKVVAILDRIKFRWHRFEEKIGEEKARQRSS